MPKSLIHGYRGTTYWSYETDARLVGFDVTFKISDYWPTCHDNPAEGGEIDIIKVTLCEYFDYAPDGTPTRSLADLSEYDRTRLEREYETLIERDRITRMQVHDVINQTKSED